MMPRLVIHPARRLEGELAVPGDKSIAHRALLVAALSDGPIEVSAVPASEDVRASLRAARALGVGVSQDEVEVEGSEVASGHGEFQYLELTPADPPGAPVAIDVGNSGTTIRLLLGILSGGRTVVTLDGDASIRRRPMLRVVDPLRRMGAVIEGAEGGERAPLTVRGTQLHGVDHVLATPSAQVKSALLFAGLQAAGATSVTEPVPTRDHTERLLRHLGARVDGSTGRYIVTATKLHGGEISIPGDVSSAAFFLVGAALLTGSEVRVPEVGLNPTRTAILRLLERFGAGVQVEPGPELSGEPRGTVTVTPGDRRPLTVEAREAAEAIDELPLVALMGALAEGETIVRGAAELRVKESDRIGAVVAGLRAMGADIEALPDGFIVRGPARLQGAAVEAAGDHRIAMTFAIAALAADGPTTIDGWNSVAVSYPGFERDLERLVVR